MTIILDMAAEAAAKNACEQYWWQDPAVLLRPQRTTATLCPRLGCMSDGVNALTRTLIIVLIVGAITYMYDGGFIVAGITGLLLSLPVIVTMLKHVDVVIHDEMADVSKEGFMDMVEPGVKVIGGAGAGAVSPWTEPTASNPFMNVLVSEYGSNPTRRSAVSISEPETKQTLDDFFRTHWYSDPTDVFGRNQSQRQFVTMPNTTIPNDRESYQNWLYKIPGKTCKEGGRQACLPATDGSPVAWMNFDA